MSTQTIKTRYVWEAERIADELRKEDAVIRVEGHDVKVVDLDWTLSPIHLRSICDVLQVQNAWLDGIQILCEPS